MGKFFVDVAKMALSLLYFVIFAGTMILVVFLVQAMIASFTILFLLYTIAAIFALCCEMAGCHRFLDLLWKSRG